MANKQILVVTALIRDGGGKVLIQRRNDPSVKWAHGRWNFPGGGIEFGETPEQALVRECQEELGCTVQVGRLLPWVFSRMLPQDAGYPEGGHQLLIICYECRIKEGIATPSCEEVSEIFWGMPKEIKKLDCLEGTCEFFEYL